MNIVVDMNLSPRWTDRLERAGFTVVHWSAVGAPTAADSEIMSWARERGYVVLTHDLDFGTLLALTREEGPSVVQVRTEDTFPETLGPLLIDVIRRYEAELTEGALLTIDERRSRVRSLPI